MKHTIYSNQQTRLPEPTEPLWRVLVRGAFYGVAVMLGGGLFIAACVNGAIMIYKSVMG